MTRQSGHSLRPSILALTLLLAGLTTCFSASGVARADEVRYSLGTSQKERELTAPAGGSSATTLAFYNIDGNVPTLVSLSVAEAPPGWRVLLSRAGDAASASETISLAVEPSLPGGTSTGCVGPERSSIYLAPRGWVCAEVVHVRVDVAESSIEGAQGIVRIIARATWETGGVAVFPQEREFQYEITVTAETDSVGEVDSTSRWLWASDSRIPLLLTALVCAGSVLFFVRRILAKSGQLA